MTTDSSLVLYENAAGQLFANAAGYLRICWSSQPRTLAQTQELFEHMAAALSQRGWSRVLINQVAMHPFSSLEQQWLTDEWLPLAVQGGYRHGAIVVSANTFTRLATSYITTYVQGLPLRYRSFDDEASATDWLLQQA